MSQPALTNATGTQWHICSPQKESGKTDVTKLSDKIKKNILALFCTSHLNENELEISDTYSQAGLGIGLMHRGT